MRRGISLTAVGHSTSLFLVLTFLICVTFDLVLPDYAMYKAWEPLLPGFDGLNWKSVFIGLFETYAYGWYVALIWVPLYNVFSNRADEREKG